MVCASLTLTGPIGDPRHVELCKARRDHGPFLDQSFLEEPRDLQVRLLDSNRVATSQSSSKKRSSRFHVAKPAIPMQSQR